jgi:hypothetical protein
VWRGGFVRQSRAAFPNTDAEGHSGVSAETDNCFAFSAKVHIAEGGGEVVIAFEQNHPPEIHGWCLRMLGSARDWKFRQKSLLRHASASGARYQRLNA